MTKEKNPQGKILIVGGGIANFTDVAATFTGLIDALKSFQDELKAHHVSNRPYSLCCLSILYNHEYRKAQLVPPPTSFSCMMTVIFLLSARKGTNLDSSCWSKLSRGPCQNARNAIRYRSTNPHIRT